MYITALELSFSDAVASKAKQTGLLRQKELKLGFFPFSLQNGLALSFYMSQKHNCPTNESKSTE